EPAHGRLHIALAVTVGLAIGRLLPGGFGFRLARLGQLPMSMASHFATATVRPLHQCPRRGCVDMALRLPGCTSVDRDSLGTSVQSGGDNAPSWHGRTCRTSPTPGAATALRAAGPL